MFNKMKEIINYVRPFKFLDIKRVWDKYYGDIPKHIEYPTCSIYDMFYNTSKKYPLYTAYNYYGKKVNYKKMQYKVKIAAQALKKIGVKEKDVILICMPNVPEAVILFYAINKIGAISSLIHPLSSEKEMEYYMKHSNAKYVLCLDLMFDKVKVAVSNTDVKKVIVSKI